MKISLIKSIILLYCCNQCLSFDPSYLRSGSKTSNNISDYPAICDHPPNIKIEPENCCEFPTVFDVSISEKCEDEFGVKGMNTSISDMISDSCVIECIFNKSGLNKDSKLHREDLIKMMTNKTKSDNVAWNKLIPMAVDACFFEISAEDLDEVAQNIKSEVDKNSKMLTNKICHPMSSIMLDCIYRELYKVCPKEKFTLSLSECSALQNYTKTCDDW